MREPMSAAAPKRGWRLWPMPTRAAVAAGWCLLSVAGVWLVQRLVRVSMIDVMVYRAAVWALPHGQGRPELRENAAQMLLAACYPLAGLAFLAVAGRVVTTALRGGCAPARAGGAAGPGSRGAGLRSRTAGSRSPARRAGSRPRLRRAERGGRPAVPVSSTSLPATRW